MGLMLPPTRAPLMTVPTGSAGHAPSARTLTHVHQEASLPVEHEEQPTRCDGPAMTPRPPARTARCYSRKSTVQSHLSSRRNGLNPPAPSGAVRAFSCAFRERLKVTRAQQPWVLTRVVISRPGVPERGHYSPELPRPGVPGRGHCRPRSPTRLPTGWHRRLLTSAPFLVLPASLELCPRACILESRP